MSEPASPVSIEIRDTTRKLSAAILELRGALACAAVQIDDLERALHTERGASELLAKQLCDAQDAARKFEGRVNDRDEEIEALSSWVDFDEAGCPKCEDRARAWGADLCAHCARYEGAY